MWFLCGAALPSCPPIGIPNRNSNSCSWHWACPAADPSAADPSGHHPLTSDPRPGSRTSCRRWCPPGARKQPESGYIYPVIWGTLLLSYSPWRSRSPWRTSRRIPHPIDRPTGDHVRSWSPAGPPCRTCCPPGSPGHYPTNRSWSVLPFGFVGRREC